MRTTEHDGAGIMIAVWVMFVFEVDNALSRQGLPIYLTLQAESGRYAMRFENQ